MPAERIETDVVGKWPAKRTDLETLLARARDGQRSSYRDSLIRVAILVGALIWMAVSHRVLLAAVFVVLVAIPTMSVLYAANRRLRRRCLELERRLESFDGQSETAGLARRAGSYKTSPGNK